MLTVHIGDNLQVMRQLPSNSVDAVITDPPYELAFMGRVWDATGVAFDAARWRECLRILKPGGHVAAFAHERTYHRTACAVEDAGFEIRAQLLWIYGTGFPKSPRDITAAIDRNRGDDPRPVCEWLRGEVKAAGYSARDLDGLFGLNGMAGHWMASSTAKQPAIPTAEQWLTIVNWLDVDVPEEIAELHAWLTTRKGQPGEAWESRPVDGVHASAAHAARWRQGMAGGSAIAKAIKTKPVSPDAIPWVGWATALRPSHEPIVLARKPMGQPVWRNALQHGTGPMHVAACRIDGDRWPPNVLLSPAAAANMDSHVAGASRYFYCAKASGPERDAGVEHRAPAVVWTDGRKVAADFPSLRGARARANGHETVKPLDVMRWLVRLLVRPGGTILEPYLGSGSTAVAAEIEGVSTIGIELQPHHAETARERHAAVAAGAYSTDAEGRTSIRSVGARAQLSIF